MTDRIRGLVTLLLAGVLVGTLACGEEITTPVDYGQGLFQFQLPGEWQSDGQVGKALYYTRVDDPEVRVSVWAEVQNWGGGPLTQRQLRAELGSRFNRTHGGAQSVVTYEGLAMVTYPNRDDGARHWVVAKPYSIGYAMYADVALHLPGHVTDEEAEGWKDEMQAKVGDAQFRE